MVEVLVNGQTQEGPVVIGLSDGQQTEIVKGLDEGQTVVLDKKQLASVIAFGQKARR